MSISLMCLHQEATSIRKSVVCNAAARVFPKGIKGHSGYSGCDKCTQPDLCINEMTFPDVDAPIRTNVAFYEIGDDKHYKGPGSF